MLLACIGCTEEINTKEVYVKGDSGDGSICIAQLVKDTFFALFHHTFIGRFVEDGFENAAEGGDAVAAQLCEPQTGTTMRLSRQVLRH